MIAAVEGNRRHTKEIQAVSLYAVSRILQARESGSEGGMSIEDGTVASEP